MVQERTRELYEAQERLVRRERLAVLGQMAGSVSHELRNPLAVISNVVYLLQTIIPDADETARESLDMLSSQTQNMQKIISDLLDFSRTRSPDREETAVSALVAHVLEKQPVPENVQVSARIPPGLPPVYVDPRQMEQVLQNLVTNACQAMPEGGHVSISARLEQDEVALCVTDTGHGMSKETVKKVFEPLFTTKKRGIGLGLALSRNLVEANGGRIQVESEEGKGSAFTVLLPTSVT
jgi:signal transduction histidine kinase